MWVLGLPLRQIDYLLDYQTRNDPVLSSSCCHCFVFLASKHVTPCDTNGAKLWSSLSGGGGDVSMSHGAKETQSTKKNALSSSTTIAQCRITFCSLLHMISADTRGFHIVVQNINTKQFLYRMMAATLKLAYTSKVWRYNHIQVGSQPLTSNQNCRLLPCTVF